MTYELVIIDIDIVSTNFNFDEYNYIFLIFNKKVY